MKPNIEAILKLFPEVTWDRWSGKLEQMAVFGWIDREDTRKDFMVLFIYDGAARGFVTSSAKHSPDFA